jgi:hypothetical protein
MLKGFLISHPWWDNCTWWYGMWEEAVVNYISRQCFRIYIFKTKKILSKESWSRSGFRHDSDLYANFLAVVRHARYVIRYVNTVARRPVARQQPWKKANVQQPLLGNGFAKDSNANNSTATRGYNNKKSGISYAVRADILQAGQVRR